MISMFVMMTILRTPYDSTNEYLKVLSERIKQILAWYKEKYACKLNTLEGFVAKQCCISIGELRIFLVKTTVIQGMDTGKLICANPGLTVN